MDHDELLDRLSARGARRAELAEQTAENDATLTVLIADALDAGISIAEIARRTGYHRNSIRPKRANG